jgi:hypothetical protein
MIEKLTPQQAVKAYCQQCLRMKQFNADQVRDCQGDHIKCPFFPYRLGKRPPVKVFRAFCIDCMGGYRETVIDCPSVKCECYPYRMGKNEARKGLGASKEAMGKARESIKKRQESIFSGQDDTSYALP